LTFFGNFRAFLRRRMKGLRWGAFFGATYFVVARSLGMIPPALFSVLDDAKGAVDLLLQGSGIVSVLFLKGLLLYILFGAFVGLVADTVFDKFFGRRS